MVKKFYLDGSEVKEPIGANNINSSIVRDRSINAILRNVDTSFTFTDDGYDYLWGIFNDNSFCEVVDVKVRYSFDEGLTFTDGIKGYIFISDIEFDQKRKYAKVKIQDGSYDSLVNNNKNVEAFINGKSTKNNNAITPPVPVKITLFDVATSTPIAITGGTGNEAQGFGFRVHDVLKYMIEFISDGDLKFRSDILNVGGDLEGACLTNGFMIKGYDGGVTSVDDFYANFPAITWDSVWSNIRKLEGLGFIIESGGGGQTLRVERTSYLENETNTLLTCNYVESIKTRVQRDYLYSSVKFSSGQLEYGTAYHFPEDINYKGFKEESYHTLGQCNIDSTLDLSTTWVTSSNAIEEAMDRGVDSALDDNALVLIFCDVDTPMVSYNAAMSNWIDPTSAWSYYNEHYNNYNISIRQFGSIPSSIAKFLGDRNYEFLAESSTDTAIQYNTPNQINPVHFQTEIYDNSSSYNPVTFEFTAPASGQFSFNVKLLLESYGDPVHSNDGALTLYPYIDVYDSSGFGGTLQSTSSFAPIGYNWTGTTTRIVNENVSVNMNSGEKAVFRLRHVMGLSGSSYKLLKKSTFGITFSETGGGIVQTFEYSDSNVIRHEITYPVSGSEYKKIKNMPRGVIEFNMDGSTNTKGKIESFKMDEERGIASIILNSSKTLNQ